MATSGSGVGGGLKCRACAKTVYVMDQQVKLNLSLSQSDASDSVVHKSCFRCRHCNASLQLSNFSSSPVDGALYCKPHFSLLFPHTPSSTTTAAAAASATNANNTATNLINSHINSSSAPPSAATAATATATKSASFQSPAISANKLTPQLTRSPSKAATMFSGTQDKCATCAKTAYPLEKVTVEGQAYHKSCFRCSHGGCTISPSNYAALEGVLYCKHHFSQLFKEKGSYNHIMKSASIKRTTAPVALPQSQPITSSNPDA